MAAGKQGFGLPPSRLFHIQATHRLIPSQWSERGTVFTEKARAKKGLAGVANSSAVLADLVLLDGATNDRIQGEQRGLIGISPFELVYGIPHADTVNAAFLHPSPRGSRFNDATRGAWYAAEDLETSILEVAYHKTRRLMHIIVPELPYGRPDRDTSAFDDWLADFQAELHTLEPASAYQDSLLPEPVPQCYAISQALAHQLLEQQSNGLLYPSVRRPGHSCVVCFRPALVYSPRCGVRLELSFEATSTGYKHHVQAVPRPS